MSLNLTIDQGNTASKIAIWNGEQLIDSVIEPTLSPKVVERFVQRHGTVRHAIYCSVKSHGHDILASLDFLAKKICQLTSETPIPITIDYKTPKTLGADRIAAAVGAWSIYGGSPLLVVDAGTAVTYDALSADGHFLGGNIAPGMSMRLEALHRFTARLPRVKVPFEINYDTFLGYDTPSAMILGAVYGIVGALTYYRSHLPDDTKVVLTGGWAQELRKLLDFEVFVETDLVSKGLNRILIYNEK
ncbi:MAG: type III pantothenate kinase [Paramuribaculum sp.]|nr:type III pantothenate kinase [Paramuribaculum sp.]